MLWLATSSWAVAPSLALVPQVFRTNLRQKGQTCGKKPKTCGQASASRPRAAPLSIPGLIQSHGFAQYLACDTLQFVR